MNWEMTYLDGKPTDRGGHIGRGQEEQDQGQLEEQEQQGEEDVQN